MVLNGGLTKTKTNIQDQNQDQALQDQDQDKVSEDQDQDKVSQDQDLQKVFLNGLKTKTLSWG